MKKLFLAFAMLLIVGAGCSLRSNVDIDTNDQVDSGDGKDTICVDTCGNGTCEELVCQGTGCPCAESVDTCSQDCR